MPVISIEFINFNINNKESYLNERIEKHSSAVTNSFNIRDNEFIEENIGRFIKNTLNKIPLKVPFTKVKSRALPIHGWFRGQRIRLDKGKMIKQVNEFFPVSEGEHIIEQYRVVLIESWREYTAGTPGLMCKSNMSDCLFFFNSVDYSSSLPIFYSNALNLFLTENYSTQIQTSFGEVSLEMAKGLLGLAPPPIDGIGAAIISSLWPSAEDAEESWYVMLHEIEGLIQRKVAEDSIQLAASKVQGIVNYLNTEYLTLKESLGTNSNSELKRILFNSLEYYCNIMSLDVISLIMHTFENDKNLAKQSFANFLNAANIHFALLQERAIQDPNVPSPSKSAYAKTIMRLVDTYSNYAQTIADKILVDRLFDITPIETVVSATSMTDEPQNRYKYFYRDKALNQTSEMFSTQKDAESARSAYYSTIESNTKSLLDQQVYSMLRYWEKLQKNPLPQVELETIPLVSFGKDSCLSCRPFPAIFDDVLHIFYFNSDNLLCFVTSEEGTLWSEEQKTELEASPTGFCLWFSDKAPYFYFSELIQGDTDKCSVKYSFSSELSGNWCHPVTVLSLIYNSSWNPIIFESTKDLMHITYFGSLKTTGNSGLYITSSNDPHIDDASTLITSELGFDVSYGATYFGGRYYVVYRLDGTLCLSTSLHSNKWDALHQEIASLPFQQIELSLVVHNERILIIVAIGHGGGYTSLRIFSSEDGENWGEPQNINIPPAVILNGFRSISFKGDLFLFYTNESSKIFKLQIPYLK